uniref:Stum, mechanosensory transduction mediator homolog n=1 Tax=Neovison vison TaxID=452646 RepID=A0A8C7B853_NEOVI
HRAAGVSSCPLPSAGGQVRVDTRGPLFSLGILVRVLGPLAGREHVCGSCPQCTQKAVPLWCLIGTFVSAFAVLCGARTDLPDRHVCCVFWLNIAAALIQTLTAIVMVGWIMSIFWGMDMVILARYKEQGIPQQL